MPWSTIFKSLLLVAFLNKAYCQIEFQESASNLGLNHSYFFGQSAGGVSFIDFNGDGLDDLTFATPKGELPHFYRNTGDGFVRNAPLVGNSFEQKQVLWVDFDNDGDQDLFICSKEAPNLLYQNIGNLILIDITEKAGLPIDSLDTFNACWADFNRDGWLDLYVCNRVPLNRPANTNSLYLNNADGTFKDVSESSNVEVAGKMPFSSSALDYDNDKWPDIYIANDRNWGNNMLRNVGNGVFEDYSEISRTDIKMDGMSVALGDFNNDDLTDIYVTNTKAGNVLFVNQMTDSLNYFQDEADQKGVSFKSTAWGANFLDADCDGDLDLYVSGSDVGTSIQSSAFYEQVTPDSFAIETMGFTGDTVKSYANAVGDFNNDGYPDIAVVNLGGVKTFLFENLGSGQNFIKLGLEGVISNRDGIGAKISVWTGEVFQSHYTHAGIGFLGQNSHQIVFGLGQSLKVDSLKIEWPTGHVDHFQNLPANQMVVFREGSSTNSVIDIDSDVTILEGNFPSSQHDIVTKDIDIFPNPSSGLISISNYREAEGIYLLNMLGQIQKSFFVPRIDQDYLLDATDIAPGFYFLVLANAKGSVQSFPIILNE